MKTVTVMVTLPSLPTARKMVEILLEKRLAVCINLFPVESHYLWRGKVEKAREVVLLAKTAQKLRAQVERAILKNHPYKVPCLEFWATHVNRDCQRWLEEELG